jgi:zinc protease
MLRTGTSGHVAWLCTRLVLTIAAAGALRAQSVRPLAYTRRVLPNGLVVLLNVDHSAPVVAIDLWYHVGAKDETAGKTGLAHLCEHLIGEGSPNQHLPHKVFVQSIGGTSTRWARTEQDVMHFYATVPSNTLEVMLWAESDRMAAPLFMADSAHVASVREVIRQERSQNRESMVFGSADHTIAERLLDAPYQIDPLGPMPDLDAATADDATHFCAPYLVPNNATLALSGDLAVPGTMRMIAKYFGGISRGTPPAHPVVAGRRGVATTRLVLEDPAARGSQIRFAWPGAAYADRDRLALNALALALTRDRASRLSKLLITERGLATEVTAADLDLEKSGVFQIEVLARPNVSLTGVERLVDSVLADVTVHPLSPAELEAVKRATAVFAVTRLQTRAARADTLAHDEVFTRDPVAYAHQLDRLMRLTAADVLRVARPYLANGHVVLSMVPQGKLELISRPDLPYENVTPVRYRRKP